MNAGEDEVIRAEWVALSGRVIRQIGLGKGASIRPDSNTS